MWKIWTKVDAAYNLGLDKYGLSKSNFQVLHFIENWEDESRKIKSSEKEFKLLHKYT